MTTLNSSNLVILERSVVSVSAVRGYDPVITSNFNISRRNILTLTGAGAASLALGVYTPNANAFVFGVPLLFKAFGLMFAAYGLHQAANNYLSPNPQTNFRDQNDLSQGGDVNSEFRLAPPDAKMSDNKWNLKYQEGSALGRLRTLGHLEVFPAGQQTRNASKSDTHLFDEALSDYWGTFFPKDLMETARPIITASDDGKIYTGKPVQTVRTNLQNGKKTSRDVLPVVVALKNEKPFVFEVPTA